MKQSGTRSGSKRGDGNRGLHDEGEKVHTSLQSPQKAPLAGRSQQNPPISLEKKSERAAQAAFPHLLAGREEEQKVGNFPPWQRPGRRGGLERDESADSRFSQLHRGYFRPGEGRKEGPLPPPTQPRHPPVPARSPNDAMAPDSAAGTRLPPSRPPPRPEGRTRPLGRARCGHGGRTHLVSSPGSCGGRGCGDRVGGWRRGGSAEEEGWGAARLRRAPRVPLSLTSLSLSPGINKVFKMAGSQPGRRKREDGGQSAPAGGGRARRWAGRAGCARRARVGRGRRVAAVCRGGRPHLCGDVTAGGRAEGRRCRGRLGGSYAYSSNAAPTQRSRPMNRFPLACGWLRRGVANLSWAVLVTALRWPRPGSEVGGGRREER